MLQFRFVIESAMCYPTITFYIIIAIYVLLLLLLLFYFYYFVPRRTSSRGAGDKYDRMVHSTVVYHTSKKHKSDGQEKIEDSIF